MHYSLMSGEGDITVIKSAIDVTVQNGFLILATVSWGVSTTATMITEEQIGGRCNHDADDSSEIRQMSLLLCPGTTVHEFKTTIRDCIGIPEEMQQLSIEGQPLLAGTLAKAISGLSTSVDKLEVRLDHIEIEPLMLSLFQMTHLGDWKDRDKMMANMMLHRNAKKCCNNSELVSIQLDENNELDFKCAKCSTSFQVPPHRRRYMIPHKAYICNDTSCSFCLCFRCFNQDEGSAVPENPYIAIQEMALDIGQSMASIGAWFGDKGHWCGCPTVRGRYITKSTKVLHDGIKLTIRFNQQARDFLQSLPHLRASMLASEVQLDCEKGVTINELIKYRNAWINSPNPVWNVLSQEWTNRYPTYSGRPYNTTSLVSFTLEEAIYEIGIQINDADY